MSEAYDSFLKRTLDRTALLRHGIQLVIMMSILIIGWRDLVYAAGDNKKSIANHEERIKAIEKSIADIQINGAVVREQQRQLNEKTEKNYNRLEDNNRKLDTIINELRRSGGAK